MKELIIRAISGLVLISFVFICVILSPFTFAFFCVFLVAFGTYEMSRLFGVKYGSLFVLSEFVVIASFSLASLVALDILSNKFLVLETLFLLLVFFMALFSRHYSFKQISTLLFASLFFVAMPSAMMVFFYQPSLFGEVAGAKVIILIFCLIWINDIFAFLSGTLLGRHKLFVRISPGKTIEGGLGGLLFTLVGMMVFCYYVDWMSIQKGMPLALIAVVFGTFGDFSESMLKRQAGVKDSGKLIPGHGGVLDRFDSILFSVPFIFVYLL